MAAQPLTKPTNPQAGIDHKEQAMNQNEVKTHELTHDNDTPHCPACNQGRQDALLTNEAEYGKAIGVECCDKVFATADEADLHERNRIMSAVYCFFVSEDESESDRQAAMEAAQWSAWSAKNEG